MIRPPRKTIPPTTDEPKSPDEDEPEEDPPATDEEDDEPENDPDRASQFTAAVAAAKDALTRRDLKEGARQLAAARQLKRGREEEQQVIYLAELQQHLGTFWRLAAAGVRKLKTGDELSFAGYTATFDHGDGSDVTLVVDGERKSRPLEDLESHYLVALSNRGATKADAKSRLAIASFLALDASVADADRELARKLLAEALAEGSRSPVLEAMFAEAAQPPPQP